MYKIQGNCIEGYCGNELTSLLFIADPVARAKYILQLDKSGELIK
jgi:hypothetical protein